MTCPHQSQPQGKDTGRRLCAIGWFGGKPFLGNCLDCIKHNRNTPEAKAEAATVAHSIGLSIKLKPTRLEGRLINSSNFIFYFKLIFNKSKD
jgi:hypothetical protein